MDVHTVEYVLYTHMYYKPTPLFTPKFLHGYYSTCSIRPPQVFLCWYVIWTVHVKLHVVHFLAGFLFPTTNHNLLFALELAEAWYDQSWPWICISPAPLQPESPSGRGI